ncbi:MAG: hypothetical protein IPH32_17265 [Bacteroidetes bacterium]|nr:hypothetical protein [Bacteroidota bacterium]
MSTYIESGHAKNTANFDHLIALLLTYGTNYTPSSPSLAITNLQTVLTNAQTALTNVKNEYNGWKNATNGREIAFDPLKGLSTRLLNTLVAVGANEQTIKDYKTFNAKVQGSKLTKADAGIIEDPNADAANKTTLPVKKTVSVSQQSFDNLIEHYDKIIKLLASVPAYNPTETALKVATLQTTLANLKTLNTAAYTSAAKVSNARIARNKILYENPDALIVLAKAVKAYIKGKFGASSPEYGQVSSIKFTKVKTGK